MTIQWLRWYRGTICDPKFRMVARYGGVTVRDVISVWALILEDASDPDHRGICTQNEHYIAAALDLEDGVAAKILAGMEAAGLVSVSGQEFVVNSWSKRQFESDVKDPTAASRMRAYRARTARYGGVTPEIRPDSESDSESDKKERGADAPQPPDSPPASSPPAAKVPKARSPSDYAFHGKVIRLTWEDFGRWSNGYANLDLRAKLQQRDDWYSETGENPKNWFVRTSNWLAGENSKAGDKRAPPSAPRDELPL